MSDQRVEQYALKMSNGQYLVIDQEDDRTLYGWLTDSLPLASTFDLEEAKTTAENIRLGKRFDGESFGKVVPEVFDFYMDIKTKGVTVKSLAKVVTFVEEEIEL